VPNLIFFLASFDYVPGFAKEELMTAGKKISVASCALAEVVEEQRKQMGWGGVE
jgi:hypothetical protein